MPWMHCMCKLERTATYETTILDVQSVHAMSKFAYVTGKRRRFLLNDGLVFTHSEDGILLLLLFNFQFGVCSPNILKPLLVINKWNKGRNGGYIKITTKSHPNQWGDTTLNFEIQFSIHISNLMKCFLFHSMVFLLFRTLNNRFLQYSTSSCRCFFFRICENYVTIWSVHHPPIVQY